MTDAHAWLAARSPAPPERLMRRMREAVERGSPHDDLVVALGDAALDCLRAALHGGPREVAALDLLAADGLLTYAWEAAAAAGADGLYRFATTYSPERFAFVLSEAR